MTININDEEVCQVCGAYWQSNGFCCNGHSKPLQKEIQKQTFKTDKYIEDEFHRIVECLKNQNELNVIEDIIPLNIKRDFVNNWEEEGLENEIENLHNQK